MEIIFVFPYFSLNESVISFTFLLCPSDAHFQACVQPPFPLIHYPQAIRTRLEFRSVFIECSFTPLRLK